jgi:hypothetical protein
MKSWLSILSGLFVLTLCGVQDGAPASERSGATWKKTTNFNNHQHRELMVKMKKAKAAVPVAKSSSSKNKLVAPTYRVLATFQPDQDALVHAPVDEPIAVARPTPGKCEWVRSIVTGYAFDHVTPKACTGSVYTFEARRGDRLFLIQASALNGDLVRVERLSSSPTTTDAAVTVEPAGQ